jgi:hypothetical protein
MRPTENSVPPAEPASHRRLRELIARAGAGDPRAVPEIRDLLRAEPEVAAWMGDLSRVVRKAWLDHLTGECPVTRQAAEMQCEERRAELAGPGAPPAERMLAGLIVNLELEAHEASLAMTACASASPAVTAARARRADSAVRRLLAATKMLRDIQQLLPNGQTPGPRLKVFDQGEQKTG